VRMDGVKSNGPRMSARRIVAMAVTIGCHLGLLMMLLRPAAPHTNITSMMKTNTAAIELRFISSPRPTSASFESPAVQATARSSVVSLKASVKTEQPPIQHIVQVTAPPIEADSTKAFSMPVAPGIPATPDEYIDSQASVGDGGFRERLLNAQHSYDVHGVPGSDIPIIPGIHLTDPMNQGIGAVMRKTQRLFRVTNRHCIDVEASQHLSQDELIARHLSLIDVKIEQEKYDCNRPLGLSF
jgi:hypothetical protein